MDVYRALLDRELLVTAVVHDWRNALNAITTAADYDDVAPYGPLGHATERMITLANRLSDAPLGTMELATFRGVSVRVRGPVTLLELALSQLPSTGMTVELHPEHLSITASGVPREELEVGWTSSRVEAWREHGGPGLAGARVRVAARLVGAMRCSGPMPAPGEYDGSLTIQLARG
jgi:hypothetical protein